jgi:hypothetical protein
MSGDILPIFPLPNVVFFPGTRLPLHVFEPRYRRMLEEALAGDRRIGMVLLRPGWEKDYHGSPETHRVGSHGSVSDLVHLPDGRYNLVLEDARRFEIVEFVQESPYRAARVRALPEGPPPPPALQQEKLERLTRLYAALARVLGEDPAPRFHPHSPEEFDRQVNSLAMSLRVDAQVRQELLEAPGCGERAGALEDLLARLVERLRALERFSRLKSSPSVSH